MSPPKVGVENANILVKVVICKTTFGGDKSPPKVSVENAVGGQREFVPAQHNFCRLATFGGDKGVAAKKLVARPPVCCSDFAPLVIVYGYLAIITWLNHTHISLPIMTPLSGTG